MPKPSVQPIAGSAPGAQARKDGEAMTGTGLNRAEEGGNCNLFLLSH